MSAPQSTGLKIISLMNQKGGVAKTTTATNIGAALARDGRRVLMVDLDPQSHLTLHLGLEPDGARGAYGVLSGQCQIQHALHKVASKLYCMPSHLDMAAAEVELAGVQGRERIMGDALYRVRKYFDYIIFDCPPSLGVLTLNALTCSSHVLIPLQAHFFALQGVGKLLETVGLVRQHLNHQLSVLGFVLCMYDSGTKLAVEVESDLQQFVDGSRGQGQPWSDSVLFRTRIRRNIKLAESPSHGRSIFDYAPLSNGATDYRNLATEIAMYFAGQWSSFEPNQDPVAIEQEDVDVIARLQPQTAGGSAAVAAMG